MVQGGAGAVCPTRALHLPRSGLGDGTGIAPDGPVHPNPPHQTMHCQGRTRHQTPDTRQWGQAGLVNSSHRVKENLLQFLGAGRLNLHHRRFSSAFLVRSADRDFCGKEHFPFL